MTEWVSDPKTLALLLGGFSQLVIAVWSGKQTAKAVSKWEEWREQHLEPWRKDVDLALERHRTTQEQHKEEIDRLRDRREQ